MADSNIIEFTVSVKLDAERLSEMSSEKIQALFAGLAQVLWSSGTNVKAEILCDQRIEKPPDEDSEAKP